MKFGVFSVSMPEYDIEKTLKVLSELGYDGVEWQVQTMPAEKPAEIPFERRYWVYNESTLDLAKIEENAAEVKRLCDQYKIEIFGLTTYLSPGEFGQIERVLKAAQIIECKQVRIFPPTYDEKEDYTILFADTVEQVKVLEKLAKQYQIKIVFEIHMDNLLASPSAAYRLVSQFDPKYIGLIYDPGNMVNEGFENYKKSFDLLGEYIAHVHVKNAILVKNGVDEYSAAQWKRQWVPLKGAWLILKSFLLL